MKPPTKRRKLAMTDSRMIERKPIYTLKVTVFDENMRPFTYEMDTRYPEAVAGEILECRIKQTGFQGVAYDRYAAILASRKRGSR